MVWVLYFYQEDSVIFDISRNLSPNNLKRQRNIDETSKALLTLAHQSECNNCRQWKV